MAGFWEQDIKIITMLEEIRVKVMDRRSQMIEFAKNKWITDISPMSYKVLQENIKRAMQYSINWNGDSGFQVTEGCYSHVVDLKLLTCSCRSWGQKGIPYAHDVASMHKMKWDPINYVSHWYHNGTYLKAYSTFIQPLLNIKMWPISEHPHIAPPEIKTLPGRPKRNQRKPKDELKKFGKLSRNGIQMTCSYYKEVNHNIKGCQKMKEDLRQGKFQMQLHL